MHLQKASLGPIEAKISIVCYQGLSKAASVSTDSLQFIRQHTDGNKSNSRSHAATICWISSIRWICHYAQHYTAKSLAAAQADVHMNGTVYQGLQAEIGQPQASFVKNGTVVLQQFKEKLC